MDSTTIENIQYRISNLSYSHKLAFAYFIAQRLFPNYVAFYKQEQWGNPEIVLKAAGVLKDYILNPNLPDAEIKLTIENLKQVTPDTDEFDSFLCSLALDACAALLESLEFIVDKNTDAILAISNSSIDLTQMYIEFRNNTDFEDYAYQDPLFIVELNTQMQILDLLENRNLIDNIFFLNTKIAKSKLGSLITEISINELEYSLADGNQTIIVPELQLESEIQEWITENNINIKLLIPELIRNFYRTMKAVQKNVAL